MRLRLGPLAATLGAVVLLAAACGSSGSDGAEDASTTTGVETATTVGATEGEDSIGRLFDDGALVSEVDVVDCTLDDGTEARCHRLTVASQPATVATGPFCPSTVDETGGIFTWDGEDPGLYALNKAFWDLLADQGYSFVDADGNVTVVDPADPGGVEAGDACLQATPDDSFTLQVLLPVEPVRLDEPVSLDTVSQVGIATDGVTIFGDAPSGTSGAIPALDPCGGHDDPSGYYHWHFGSVSIQAELDAADLAVVCDAPQDDEALVGWAYDGYPIYGPQEDGAAPTDLDACSGHEGPTADLGETYHYHLTTEAPNLPGCRVGAVAVDKLTSPDNPAASLPDGSPGGGDGAPGGPQGGPPPP